MTTRLSVNINDETAAAIRTSQTRRQTTATEVLRRAVSVYKFLDDARRRGDEIRLVSGDGTIERVTWT
jgi:hypothetical protein